MNINSDSIKGILFNKIRNYFDLSMSLEENTTYSFAEVVKLLAAAQTPTEKIEFFKRHIKRNLHLFDPGHTNGNTKSKHWPKSQSELTRELFFTQSSSLLVNKKTPIISLGSCFAVEIAKWLQRNGYNFLVTEDNYSGEFKTHNSSANWGTIFNSPSFFQVVSWAFGESKPPLVTYKVNGKHRDPFREEIFYSEEQLPNLAEEWAQHLLKSRLALESAEVVILTVGLNEVFQYIPTSDYLHRTPWGLNPLLWSPKILSVEENVKFIKDGVAILRKYNPSVKFITSVSPVPLMRSIRSDCHVAAATAHSKAILRVALEILARDIPDFYYMPSFETVMYAGNKINVWNEDGRHVDLEVVQKIMVLFQKMFCGVDGGLEAAWWHYEDAIGQPKNPFYIREKRIINAVLSEMIAEGLIDMPVANTVISSIRAALRNDEFDENAYKFIRKFSFISKFKFNNKCKAQFRKEFSSKSISVLSEERIGKLDDVGYLVIPANAHARTFSQELLRDFQNLPIRREIDGKVGFLEDLCRENVPDAHRYFRLEEDLPLSKAVNFLHDSGVLDIVNAYLGSAILRNINCWHSVVPQNKTHRGIDRAAMMFHRDNDLPLGWLKVFVYLTDVTSENGPHVYVPQSHRIIRDGLYEDCRLADNIVAEAYGQPVAVLGGSGTIIIGDTQCLHKGLEPKVGNRTVLQFEFCNSLLGAITPGVPRSEMDIDGLDRFGRRFLHRYLRK